MVASRELNQEDGPILVVISGFQLPSIVADTKDLLLLHQAIAFLSGPSNNITGFSHVEMNFVKLFSVTKELTTTYWRA